jgi:hypothetical protein
MNHNNGNAAPQPQNKPSTNLDDIFGSGSSQQTPIFSFDDAHHETPITPHQANTASSDPFFNFTQPTPSNGTNTSAPKANNSFFDEFSTFNTSSTTTKGNQEVIFL